LSLVGQPAPALKLPNQKKEVVDLATLRGKKVVVAFFPAAFTGVCTAEMCTFRDAMAALNDLNAVVLGVSVDGPFANGAFATHNGLEFSILSDLHHEAIRAWDVVFENFAGVPGYTAARRSVFVVDENGAVTWEWHAPNPGVQPDYDAVKAALA
jgi:peroxiredoxin